MLPELPAKAQALAADNLPGGVLSVAACLSHGRVNIYESNHSDCSLVSVDFQQLRHCVQQLSRQRSVAGEHLSIRLQYGSLRAVLRRRHF